MVPKRWKNIKLAECLDDISGGGTPSRGNGAYWNGTIPWASVKDMTAKGYTGTKEHITQAGLVNSSSRLIPAGNVVMATRMAVGSVKRFECDVAINQDLKALITSKSLLSNEYLFQWMLWNRSNFEAISTGSTVKGIRVSALKNFPIALPPLPEQKKIAAILSSVDEAIEATEAVIEQTRTVKKGLLQELLTRGIGHTEFKKTAIGEIPRSWRVMPIKKLLANTENPMRSGPFGSALLKNELVDQGIPVLGIDNVKREQFIDKYRRFITEEKFSELDRYQVFPNDVMITIMGTVGRSCVVPSNIKTAISSKHVWTLTFDNNLYDPYLACAQINYAQWVISHFEADSQGGTMDAIRSKTLKNTLLPVPPIEEQRQITRVLNSLDESIKNETLRLNILKELKHGLLQDLLTGKVRVNNIDLPALSNATAPVEAPAE